MRAYPFVWTSASRAFARATESFTAEFRRVAEEIQIVYHMLGVTEIHTIPPPLVADHG